jgi:hypothetical protein
MFVGNVLKDDNFTQGYGTLVPSWAGYGHILIPRGNTHNLPIKSRVGHG